MDAMDANIVLQQALDRLKQGQASQTDLDVLRQALRAKRISLVSGERAVALSQGVTDTVIITGDGNVVTVSKEADARVLQHALDDIRRSAWRRLVVGLVAGVGCPGILVVVAFALLVGLGIIRIPSRAVVAASDTPLLSSPDSQSEAVAQLNNGQKVEVLGQIPESLWLHIETEEGDSGWVRKGDLAG